MELGFNNRETSESDREFYEAMERRRRRRMQKRQREKRKKCIIAMIFGIVVISVVIAIVVNVTGKKETAGAEEKENITEEANSEVSEEISGQISEEVCATALGYGKVVANLGWSEFTSTQSQSTDKPNEAQTTEPKENKVYQFEETSNTVNIYSEEVFSTNAILVDADADEIVAVKGAYDRISPASMTKVMTILVAAEAIEEADLDDTFTMTLEITDYAYINDCSYVGFLDGEVVTVRDLFYGTVLPSGGDAAVGLATYVAGSHEAFVDMMNAKLEELGLSDSAHFTNCVGLYDTNHYCTVYDMAVIMDAAMENELCREILSAHTYTTTPTTQHPEGIEISNWFLRRIEDKDTGGLVVGAKTGYVVESGSCAASCALDGEEKEYICVTADSTSSWRCIYDHVEIYKTFLPQDNTAAEEVAE